MGNRDQVQALQEAIRSKDHVEDLEQTNETLSSLHALPATTADWLEERLSCWQASLRFSSEESTSPAFFLAILDLSASKLEDASSLLTKCRVASRVAASTLSRPEEAVLLHLWAVAPEGSHNDGNWESFRMRLRRDDRTCPKDIWLVPDSQGLHRQDAQRFLQEGPLARPWNVDQAKTHETGSSLLDMGAHIFDFEKPALRRDSPTHLRKAFTRLPSIEETKKATKFIIRQADAAKEEESDE